MIIFLPLVLAYQTRTYYYVFQRRISRQEFQPYHRGARRSERYARPWQARMSAPRQQNGELIEEAGKRHSTSHAMPPAGATHWPG